MQHGRRGVEEDGREESGLAKRGRRGASEQASKQASNKWRASKQVERGGGEREKVRGEEKKKEPAKARGCWRRRRVGVGVGVEGR